MKQVPGDIKNARAAALGAKAEEDALRFYDLCQGAVRRVLVEELAGDGLVTGYTDNYIKTYVPGDESMLNQFYDVKLVDRFKDGMKGELANG
jgi:threonylcarbamoyladenosine tRNA methylthiotransferase MtaB